MPKLEEAGQLAAKAAQLILAAQQIADKHTQYASRRDTVAKLKFNELDKTHAAVAPKVSAIQLKLTAAEEQAKAHDYVKAAALLEESLVLIAAAAELKVEATRYAHRLGVLTGSIPATTSGQPPTPDPVFTGEVAKINTTLLKAKAAADLFDYAKAGPLLEQAALQIKAANVKKKMSGNQVPSDEELKAICDQPGGGKILDEAIAGLDENQVQQKVLIAAINARFNVKMENLTSKTVATQVAGTVVDKNVKQIYTLLKRVPDKYGKNNPKMGMIVNYATDSGQGGDYSDGKVNLYLQRVDAGGLDYNTQTKPGSPMFNKFFPDGVEASCKQSNDAPCEYYDWATLHEVGHAVDDRRGFMRKRMSEPAFGGWIDYGADVWPVARAGAEFSSFDAVDYLAGYLTGQAPVPPAPPTVPAELLKYNAAKLKAENWCDAIREGKGLWWDGGSANANAVTIDGATRVFQESYAGKWVSYLLAARKQGIHGYQFRAPGEWFAELYAAYYCKKLKDTHPAVSNGTGWLAKLDEPS